MKWYKTGALILSVTFLFALFAGCRTPDDRTDSDERIETENRYQSFILDASNDGIKMESEIASSKSLNLFDKSDRKVCTFEGVQYEGVYLSSNYFSNSPFIFDKYMGDTCTFWLNHDTGELVYFTFASGKFFDKEALSKDVENPEENALNMAKALLSKYVQNIDDYEMSVQVIEREGYTRYSIKFVRYIQGFKTLDCATISITSKGHLITMSLGNLGVFANTEISWDEESVKQSVEARLRDVYSAYEVQEYQFESQRLVAAPDGTYGIETAVFLTIKEGEFDIGTAIAFYTPIGSFSE